MKNLKKSFSIVALAFFLYACSPADGNYTGSEYMPDMAHSIAVEANVYTNYGLNTWDEESVLDLKTLSNPGEPVKGTVPRGYAGVYFAQEDEYQKEEMMQRLRGELAPNEIAVPVNGSVPYYYEDTDEDRLRATAEIIGNPFPITADGLERGEELYNIFCGICHGETGNGLGYLANPDDNPDSKYLAVPANLLSDTFLLASNGRLYHAIMYGKNVMGAYDDKLSYEERWQVIHYIRSLQAKEKKLAYNAEENTLNPNFATPLKELEQLAELGEGDQLENVTEPSESHDAGEGHSDENHNQDEH